MGTAPAAETGCGSIGASPDGLRGVKTLQRSLQHSRAGASGVGWLPLRRQEAAMLIVTTDGIEGRRIVEYQGIVSGDAIVGAHLFRDVFARVRDVGGGRAGGYEKAPRNAEEEAREAINPEAPETQQA